MIIIEENNFCTCDICGNEYKIDIIVPDKVWKIIKPENTVYPDGGCICGPCIIKRMEKFYSYDSYTLIKTKNQNIFKIIVRYITVFPIRFYGYITGKSKTIY